MSLSPFEPRSDVLDRLNFALQLFQADVRSMSSESLAATCGGASRCGYDFLFEMIGFFDTFASLLGEGPKDIQGPSGEWVRAPQDFYDKDQALAGLDAASKRFIEAISSYSGDFVADVFPSPVGPFTPLGMANLGVWHTMYHSGQLNYIQTVQGDAAFHWMPEAP